MGYAKVATPEHADEILQIEIGRQNRTVNRSTSLLPLTTWDQDLLGNTALIRPTPVGSL